jgi:hypothetical protein
VLIKIFGRKEDEISGQFRTLNKEGDLHSSPDIVRAVKSRACGQDGEMRNIYKILVQKCIGKHLLGRARRK